MCIASHIVIAILTIVTAIVVALLIALAKSNGDLFAIAFKRESHQQKKQRTDTKKDAKSIKIALRGAIVKSPILLSQY